MNFRFVALFLFCFVGLPINAGAQEAESTLDKNLIPLQASEITKFVPRGWMIEKRLSADLNGDNLSDYVLELVEKKPAKDSNGDATERARALVVALHNQDGTLSRAAVATRLLQCTRCGGAFYGVVESPANVSIERGVIIVGQEHGSRDVTRTTYRFRYDAETQRFILIGFDYADADRLTGNDSSESTNYLTGMRKVSRGKSEKASPISKTKIFMDDVDFEKFEEEADARLHP